MKRFMKQIKRLKSLLQRRGSVRVYKMADGADGKSQMCVFILLFCVINFLRREQKYNYNKHIKIRATGNSRFENAKFPLAKEKIPENSRSVKC